MINLEIRKFKETLICITNASQLPIEVKRMVFGEVYGEINEMANHVVLSEKEEAEKKAKEQEETKNE